MQNRENIIAFGALLLGVTLTVGLWSATAAPPTGDHQHRRAAGSAEVDVYAGPGANRSLEQDSTLPLGDQRRRRHIPEDSAAFFTSLEDIAVAIDPMSGNRVFVCGFDDDAGTVMQNTYMIGQGYLGWTLVPGANEGTSGFGTMEGVALHCFTAGARIYMRAFGDGTVQHNTYTPQLGFTGWSTVPDPNDVEPIASLEAISLRVLGEQISSPRIITRGLDNGTVQQNIFTPQQGWTGWTDLPPFE
jgi:hypothetical protein